MQYDTRVDEYIAMLPAWQQEICNTVRMAIHQAEPQIQEVIKRKILPYFVLDGNVCALMATKDHVNVFIYDPIAADPDGVINQGDTNATARSIQIYQGQVINVDGIKKLIANVVANNRSGGWRKVDGR